MSTKSDQSKTVACPSCGGREPIFEAGYFICTFCRSSFTDPDAITAPITSIVIQSDVQILLDKCESDPENRARYASLVLDIDPTNKQALTYLS